MRVDALLFLAMYVTAMAAALSSLVFFVWAFVGRRTSRSRRLRISAASLAILVVGVASAVVAMYFIIMPGELRSRPGFEPPYEVWHTILNVVVLLTLIAVAVFAAGLIVGSVAKRRWVYLTVGLVLLCAAASGANWHLIYGIQVPAYSRYVMIENREWMTRVGDAAPEIQFVMLNGSEARLSELRGKVLLINFFATWCGPCLHELPHMEKLWNQFKN